MTKEQKMLEALNKIANDDLDKLVTDVRGNLDKMAAKVVWLRLVARECLREIKNEVD